MHLKTLLLTFFVFTEINAASMSLANFVPGEYAARTGKESECPSGEFKLYSDDGTKLTLAGVYIFDLRNYKERLADDVDETQQCFYDAEDSMDTMGNSSLLVFKETRKCGEVTKHILTRKLTITKNNLVLNVTSEGESPLNFSCSWSLVKRKVNALKKSKK